MRYDPKLSPQENQAIALFEIARALERLGIYDGGADIGAIELLAGEIKLGLGNLAGAFENLANAVENINNQ